MGLKLGVVAPYQRAPVEEGAYVAEFARLVEELGFESVWAVEHVVMCTEVASRYPYDPSGRSPFRQDTIQPDPLVWLTWAAAATRNLRLGTGILILPQHNPVVLAKTVASLDRISGGRLLLGIGVGWVREEAEAVGTAFEDRGRRTDEYIRAMRALWTEPVASFRGETVRFEGVVSEPRPFRPEGVPLLVGGHSRAAARRAGRFGDGFYPLGVDRDELAGLRRVMEEAARDAGRDPAKIEITSSGPATAERARELADMGVDRMVVFPPTGDLEKLRGALASFREQVDSL